MTTITPPTAPQPPPAVAGAPPVVVVKSPPPALARLPVGQLLNATVSTQIAKDVFQVQTPMGQLSLQSSVALPKGGALVLQLLSHSPSVQFQISSLNGAAPPLSMKTGKLTPGAAQTQNLAATGVSSSSKMATGASASAPKLTPGNVLQATLMRPLSQPSSGRALQTPGSLTSPATAPAAVAKGAPVNTGGLPPASATKGTWMYLRRPFRASRHTIQPLAG